MAAEHQCCRRYLHKPGGKTVNEHVGSWTNVCIVGRCLARAEMGSCVCSSTWVSSVSAWACHTQTHVSFRSAYHPHVGRKPLQLLQIFSLSASYKRETPFCPRPLCALNGPAEVSSVQPGLKTAPGGHIADLLIYRRISARSLRPVSPSIQMWPWMFSLCLCATAGRCLALDTQFSDM